MEIKKKRVIPILFLLICSAAIIIGVRLFYYREKEAEKVEYELHPEKKTYTIVK